MPLAQPKPTRGVRLRSQRQMRSSAKIQTDEEDELGETLNSQDDGSEEDGAESSGEDELYEDD